MRRPTVVTARIMRSGLNAVLALLAGGARLAGADLPPTPASAPPPMPAPQVMTCRDPLPSPDARPWTAPATVPDGIARLTAGLWRQLQGDGNLALSPCSLHACLAMLSAGARGETLAQLQHAAELPAPAALASGWSTLAPSLIPLPWEQAATTWSWTMANALFVERGFPLERSFTAVCRDDYHADATVEDFADTQAAAKDINHWCAQATAGLIRTIMDPRLLNASTRLVAVDAVHFSAPWQDAFASEATAQAPFHRTGRSDVAVSCLHATRAFAAAELDGARVVALPYAGGQIEALVVVPIDPDGLGALDARLDAPELARLAHAPHPGGQVALTLPKLHLAGAPLLMRDTLAGMGMPLAFKSGADFSGIAPVPLRISQVVHRCVIDLDERGTTAAAATAAVLVPHGRAIGSPPLVVRADHPFLLLIRDKPSGAILFIARVEDPSQP